MAWKSAAAHDLADGALATVTQLKCGAHWEPLRVRFVATFMSMQSSIIVEAIEGAEAYRRLSPLFAKRLLGDEAEVVVL